MYFNAFIHVHSPLGTNVNVNRKPLSLCPFVTSFKTISLKYDFKHILNDFIHVYSPRQGQTTPWGLNFEVNRNSLSLCPFDASLKKSLWSLIFFTIFYVCFFHMYIATGRGRQSTALGTKKIMTTERPFLFAHMLQVSKWSLWNMIVYTFLMILYM